MTKLALTRHGEVRLGHRGLCNADAALLRNVATPLAGDAHAWFLTDADVARETARREREIQQRKREIQQLRRLRGMKIVVAGDAVVTAYRPSIKNQRRDLRQHRRHGQ
jgi:hypothetical protein